MASTRPRVVLSVTATVDGRVSLGREERLLDDDVDRRWRSIWPPDVEELLARRATAIERLQPTAVLEGSGTFVAGTAGPVELPDTDGQAWTDFVPHRTPKWFVVVDGRGRVPWSHKGDAITSLLVLVSRSTPSTYLAHLRREEIPYLVVGTARVDLELALIRLREVLGVECVVAESGGGLNGALLDAGLVDELHVLTVPGLVGGLSTPSIMDGPERRPGTSPIALRATHVEVGSHGSVLASYAVVR
ncbi:RibD family protein [Cellulomonas humilata]|uniref:Riboflavin biosynthesis pyrimidine reductase n=1 Tax=Cellulomonas humilata TaxID=144055 RepID=A0ABU0EHH6_9CELL|nr:dihydrofolate reductase family protein [Cellulomonas humilata]MDQ0374735.1 riboflavin biosynthesis pyrimidine reductase [Cellulomonas humilata]